MALQRTNLSSGGLTRTNLSGSSPVKASAAASAAAEKPKRWMGALLSNLEEFARGVGPGVKFLATAAWNDADRAVTGSSRANQFLFDDVGKAVKDDYVTRYKDLGQAGSAALHGDLRKSWHELGQFKDQVATRPLDFILDAATVATLGGAAVGTVPAKIVLSATKAASKAGRAARTGEALMKASGSLRRAGYVPAKRVVATLEDGTPVTALDQAKLVYGAASKEVRDAERTGVVRGVREIGTKAVEQGRYKQPLLRPLKTNAVLAKRDAVVERAIGSNRALEKLPLVGLQSRWAKQSGKRPSLELAIRNRSVDEAQKALNWMDMGELAAWEILHQAPERPVEYARDYAHTLDESAARLEGDALRANRARAALYRDPKVLELAANPSKRVLHAVEQTRHIADDVMRPIMRDTVGMSEAALNERALLPQRVAAGARSTQTHPTDLRPTRDAEKAGRLLPATRRRVEREAGKLEAQAAELRKRSQEPNDRDFRRADALDAQAASIRQRSGGLENQARGRGDKLDEVPVERMSPEERAAAGEVVAPARGAGRAERTLERMRAAREAMADRLRDVALRLREEIRAHDEAVAKHRAAKKRGGAGKLEPRAMTRREAIADAPERVRQVPEPGEIPSDAQVTEIIRRMRHQLTKGRRWSKPRKELERFLARVYNEARYGTASPTDAMKRQEAAAVRAARARRKGRASDAGSKELVAAADRWGVWSPRTSRLAEEADAYHHEVLWKSLRRWRAEDKSFRAGMHPDSLEYALARKGYHPSDASANSASHEADIADVVDQWLDEVSGDGAIVDIALGNEIGAMDSGASGARPDMDGAQGLIEQARLGDPDLPPNPTNGQVADGIAATLIPDESVADIPKQKEWIRRQMEWMLPVYEDGAQHSLPEFVGKIRRRDEAVLARELGIRDDDMGVMPTGDDWARAVQAKLDEVGFTEEYRKDAHALRQAERNAAEIGALAFRDERFVPDPDQTDFGTLLEFVPGVSKAEIDALAQTARALTSKERATLRRAAATLEKEARRMDSPSPAERMLRKQADAVDVVGVERPLQAVSPEARRWSGAADRLRQQRIAQAEKIERRAEQLREAGVDETRYDAAIIRLEQRAEQLRSTPGREERRLLARAEQMEPMPLKGNLAPDGLPYRKSELVDPETGALYRDGGSVLTQPDGSYLPHVLPRDGVGLGGGLRARVSVAGRPSAPASVTKQSTGELFAAGTYENTAIALLERARVLNRVQYAADLFNASLRDMGMPFNADKMNALGGLKEWVVLNPEQVAGVTKEIETLAGMFENLKGLLPDEQMDEVIKTIRKSAEESATVLANADDASRLVMVPRKYYERLVGDLQQAGKWEKLLIDRPLDFFRTIVLFTRPAYYVNNIVGQHFLLAMRDPAFLPTYIRYVTARNLDTGRRLFGLATDPASTSQAWKAFFEKHGKVLHGASAGQVETSGLSAHTARMAMSGHRGAQMWAGLLRSPRTANEIGSILSDDIPREVRAVRLMQPHVKAAREAGEAGDDATIAMRLLDNDPVLKERILEQTLFDLVDYRSLSPFEKRVMRKIVPFYGWMRGITAWTLELGYNHPEQLLAMSAVSTVGQDVANAGFNDRVPEWMQGSMLVGAEKDGMQRAITTQGLNPMSTLADMSLIAKGAFGDQPIQTLSGGATMGSLNPYLQSLAAGLNGGKELGTPYKMLMPGQVYTADDNKQWPGFIGSAVGGFLASTPENRLWVQHKMASQNPGGIVSPSGVYQSPWSDYFMSFMGYPVRNINMAKALQRRRQDAAVLSGEGARY